jgi:glycerate kinase
MLDTGGYFWALEEVQRMMVIFISLNLTLKILLAGFGALQAMGMKITIKEDNIYEPETFYGKHLPLVHEISIPKESLLPECSIEIACDVDSPFVGPKGATYVS